MRGLQNQLAEVSTKFEIQDFFFYIVQDHIQQKNATCNLVTDKQIDKSVSLQPMIKERSDMLGINYYSFGYRSLISNFVLSSVSIFSFNIRKKAGRFSRIFFFNLES